MGIVDADTHVDETEQTWQYMGESERAFLPMTLEPPESRSFVPGDARPHRLWMYAGEFRLRRHRDDERTCTTRETRELLDVPARLRHMDELGTEIQVIYPTLFLNAVSTRPEVEVALARSYNRWLADVTRQSNGRLRWVAVLPLQSIEESVKEVRFAKDQGAVGLLKHGIECGDRAASDPYFYPVYEAASQLDIPICVHTGNGNPNQPETSAAPRTQPQRNALPVLAAFSSFVIDGVPDLFPNLRIGFIEAGASWLPYLLNDLQSRAKRQISLGLSLKEDLLRRSRFYVTCDTRDDLPYILQYGCEDSLMIGSDYTHADASAQIDAPQEIVRKGEDGTIGAAVAHKITDANARAFYGL